MRKSLISERAVKKMALNLAEYKEDGRKAVEFFWKNRDAAKLKQIKGGAVDRGERSSVTAGKNMDGFRILMQNIIKNNGLMGVEIHEKRAMLTLPGYFRPTKLWDLVVTHNNVLVAAIELKSHIGPSFGNNSTFSGP